MYINRKLVLPFSMWDDSDGVLTMFSEASDFIYIGKLDYEKIIQNLEGENSLIFRIFLDKRIVTSTRNATVRIGGYHNDDNKIIYAPEWVIRQLNTKETKMEDIDSSFDSDISISSKSGGGRVNMLQVYDAPLASKIKIQVLNPQRLSIYSGLNTQAIYEEALQHYGGVELNRIIPLMLKIQEDFEVDIEVKVTSVEPENPRQYVRFDGDVILDFNEPELEPEPFREVNIPDELIESEPIVSKLNKEELRAARLRFFDKV